MAIYRKSMDVSTCVIPGSVSDEGPAVRSSEPERPRRSPFQTVRRGLMRLARKSNPSNPANPLAVIFDAYLTLVIVRRSRSDETGLY
jgi:hypothetical protein